RSEPGQPSTTALAPATVPCRSLPRYVRHQKALDRLPLTQVGLEDLLQVRGPHARIPDVLGVDGEGDAAAAVLEAVRAADDDAIAQPPLLHHRLQRVEDRLGALLAAAALGVARRPHVEAHQHVPL